MLPKIKAADIRAALEKEKARPKDRWGGWIVDHSSDLLSDYRMSEYAVDFQKEFIKQYMCQFENIQVITTKELHRTRYDDEKMVWDLGPLQVKPRVLPTSIGGFGISAVKTRPRPLTEAELRAAEGSFTMGLILKTDSNGFLPCEDDELVHIDDVKVWAKDSLKGRTTALILMNQGSTVGYRFTFDFDEDKVMFKLRWF